MWTHTLNCDVLTLRHRGIGESYLFELRLARAEDENHVSFGWPVIESETQFLLRLVRTSANPWHIYILHTIPDQVSSVLVQTRTLVDVAELQEKETKRLEILSALRLLRKVTEVKGDNKQFAGAT